VAPKRCGSSRLTWGLGKKSHDPSQVTSSDEFKPFHRSTDIRLDRGFLDSIEKSPRQRSSPDASRGSRLAPSIRSRKTTWPSAWPVSAGHSQLCQKARLFPKSTVFPYGDAFNQDISRWDVSQVQSMAGMFSMAPAFHADITSWDTSSLVASENMFLYATAWLAKYQRKDGKEVWMGIACSSGGTPLPGDMSCFDGPPSAWQKRDLPPLPPSPPHIESPPPPAQTLSLPLPPPGSIPEVSLPPAPAYDPPTTSVGVGTVVLVAFIMLVIGFVSGYLVRLLRSKKGVPILDEDPDEENFERAPLSSDA
jgi:hypothetical protein